MKKKYTLFLLILFLFAATTTFAAPVQQGDPIARVRNLVLKYFPEAQMAQDNSTFVAQQDTMIFTVHAIGMTGEIRETTNQLSGPNYKGFILRISTRDGEYQGQAVTPQTLRNPYWQTFMDRSLTEDGKGHYSINFSYGSRLDRQFKEELFKVLPNSRGPQ